MDRMVEEVAVLHDVIRADTRAVDDNASSLHGVPVVFHRSISEFAAKYVYQRPAAPTFLAERVVSPKIGVNLAQTVLEVIWPRPRISACRDDNVGEIAFVASFHC